MRKDIIKSAIAIKKDVLATHISKYLFNEYAGEMRESNPDISWADISTGFCKKYHMRPVQDDFEVMDRFERKLMSEKKDSLVIMYLQIPEGKREKLKGKPQRLFRVYLEFDYLGVIKDPEHVTMAFSPQQALLKVLSKYTDHPDTLYGIYKRKMLDSNDGSVIVEPKLVNPNSERARRQKILRKYQFELGL